MHGVLFEKGTGVRLAKASIANLRTNGQVTSDDLGGFQIATILGDSIRITKKDFTTQILAVLSQQILVLQLQPVIELQEVTIKGETKKQELELIMDDYRRNGSFYKGKPPALAFLKSPITVVYELFGKTPGQARRFGRFMENDLEQSEIDRRFTKAFVKDITELDDEKLKEFMDSFRPSYEQVSKWNEYDLVNYIKKSLDSYKGGNIKPPPPKLY
ncbi:MAG: hypothetical protein ACOH2A_02620 [Sphingobacteriaceae bacterium]